jgi:DNA-directed RNA polymerase subunit RPC12/RpoP
MTEPEIRICKGCGKEFMAYANETLCNDCEWKALEKLKKRPKQPKK